METGKEESPPQPCQKRQKLDEPAKDKDGEVEWRLYHPKKKKQKSFQIGDNVIILTDNNTTDKPTIVRRGTVVAVEKREVQVSIKNNGYQQKEETKEVFSRREWNRLLPSFETTTTNTSDVTSKQQVVVIVTPETEFFRHLAYQADPNDKILEIGCSSGETSRLFMSWVQSWVGLDTSDEMIAKCQEKIKENAANNKNITKCHVAKVDALVDPATARKEARTFGNPTVVFLDIGGNRECINVVRMLSWVLDTFPSSCRLVVIKSRELVQSIRSSATTTLDNNIIRNGHQWFLEHKRKRAFPKHPLRAPLVLSPKDGKTPICRYHNYHKHGCSKGERCELDHDYCHACQQLGHNAKECPSLSQQRDAE